VPGLRHRGAPTRQEEASPAPERTNPTEKPGGRGTAKIPPWEEPGARVGGARAGDRPPARHDRGLDWSFVVAFIVLWHAV